MHGDAISPLLSDALVILGAAGIVIPLFARFRITPIIGFILIGLLVGPFGLGRMVPGTPWLTTEQFFEAIVKNLEAEMATWGAKAEA